MTAGPAGPAPPSHDVRLGPDGIRARVFPPAAGAAHDPPRGVALAHDVYGVDGPGVDGPAARLASFGYAVIAPDLYARAPDARPPHDPPWTDAQKAAAVRALPDRGAVRDLDDACAHLIAAGLAAPDAVAVAGFCMGGTLAWLCACTASRARAVISFYGRIVYPELSAAKPVQPLELVLNLGAPFLGLYAEEDPLIPPADVERLRVALSQAARDFDIVVYPGTRHGFAHSPRGTFHPTAAADAWRRVRAFLDERLA